MRAPDVFPLRGVRQLELDGERDTPMHRLIQHGGAIRRQNDEAIVPLDLRKDEANLRVVAVAALEDPITFVKKEHRLVYFRLAEEEPEGLLTRHLPDARIVHQ